MLFYNIVRLVYLQIYIKFSIETNFCVQFLTKVYVIFPKRPILNDIKKLPIYIVAYVHNNNIHTLSMCTLLPSGIYVSSSQMT